ncbi:hypothetical protein G6F24_015787 [Rhizopus arrhizus]|nr:hypothetical protein G6F24_015787 [Rhizopus arrhizus]
MSITAQPARRRPSARPAASSGPDRRPSRPITTSRRPCSSAAVPMAWPISAAVFGVSSLPTTPRMSRPRPTTSSTAMKASSSATMALASAPSPSGPGSTLGTAATSRSGVPATGRASASALSAR